MELSLKFYPNHKILQRLAILKINNESIIAEKEHTNYLGIAIDKHLNWKAQIKN